MCQGDITLVYIFFLNQKSSSGSRTTHFFAVTQTRRELQKQSNLLTDLLVQIYTFVELLFFNLYFLLV